MQTLKVGDSVKLQKKGEHSGFSEVGRGSVIALADGKSQWVKYLDRETDNPSCGEWICVDSPSSKVLLW